MFEHLHQVTTTSLLRQSGLGAQGIAGRVARGELVRTRPGRFIAGSAPRNPEQVAAEALLAAPGQGVITGWFALKLWGLPGPEAELIDISVPYGAHVPEVAGARYRRSSHAAAFGSHERKGLRVVPGEWAYADLGRDFPEWVLARHVASAIGQRMITLDALADLSRARDRFSGSAKFKRALRALDSDLAFSGTERRCAKLLRALDVPVKLNVPITFQGRTIRLADLALAPLKLDLEIDGPHHWLPEQAAADRRVDRLLREIEWAVERFDVYEIDRNPAAWSREALRVIARRSQELNVRM